MYKQRDYYYKVLNVVLLFKEKFTIKELIETLRVKEIMDDNNKQQVLDSVDEVMESGLIRHIHFTEEYYVA